MAHSIKTEEMEKALRKHNGYVYLAATSLGCAPKTIYARLKEVGYLRDALDEIRGAELDITEMQLRKAILNGEPWAIALKLKTQGKERGYSERTEVTGSNSEPIQFIIKRLDEQDN